MSLARTFEGWDRALGRNNPDYTALYSQMKSVARMRGSECNVELWWRLSAVTYGLSLNLDPATERDACRVRTNEAKGYAERAIKISPRNFNANLWMAVAEGQLCLLEDCFEVSEAKLCEHCDS